jgi:hypothetical protein
VVGGRTGTGQGVEDVIEVGRELRLRGIHREAESECVEVSEAIHDERAPKPAPIVTV